MRCDQLLDQLAAAQLGCATIAQARSCGLSADQVYRRFATLVDKILKGESPANLPIEVPTRFELVINLKAAKAIDLTISESVLVRADEVLE